MRPRPTILLDVLAGAIRALGTRAADEGRYEEFAVQLQRDGMWEAYEEADDFLESKLNGQPCPGCHDKPGAVCSMCGWTPKQLPPPGWYADPEYDGYRRYWTGQKWQGDPVEMTDDDEEVNGVYAPAGWDD